MLRNNGKRSGTYKQITNFFKIRPKMNEFLQGAVGNRRDEVVLTRFRVGHTHLTHSFIFKQEDRPMCFVCDEVLSVKHILLHCADLIEIRHRHFTLDSMKRLFRDVPPDVIFNFLREIKHLSFDLDF